MDNTDYRAVHEDMGVLMELLDDYKRLTDSMNDNRRVARVMAFRP
jgi:hypothetical protein